MPARRDEDLGVPEESSTAMCKLANFYRKYRIEFHISGMVFCLIGGKVKTNCCCPAYFCRSVKC